MGSIQGISYAALNLSLRGIDSEIRQLPRQDIYGHFAGDFSGGMTAKSIGDYEQVLGRRNEVLVLVCITPWPSNRESTGSDVKAKSSVKIWGSQRLDCGAHGLRPVPRLQ
jgi:hypothetical protein